MEKPTRRPLKSGSIPIDLLATRREATVVRNVAEVAESYQMDTIDATNWTAITIRIGRHLTCSELLRGERAVADPEHRASLPVP